MKCPHCRVDFHDELTSILLGNDTDGVWVLVEAKCSACNRYVLHLVNGEAISESNSEAITPSINLSSREAMRSTHIPAFINRDSILIRPKGSSRPPCPEEVPKSIAEDYAEACLVLSDSRKASAAMSRRCLQHILRDAAKITPSDLAKEIQEVIGRGNLPSYITEALDAVRHIGNFAAHPMKSTASGEILPVESGEAEWNLDVLESLFDFFYVQPTALQKKKDNLNRKLQEAGKKPMK